MKTAHRGEVSPKARRDRHARMRDEGTELMVFGLVTFFMMKYLF